MKILKDIAVTLIGAFAILFFLRITGLMNGFSAITNSVVMQTGLLDAASEPNEEEVFDYHFLIKDLNENKIAFEKFKGKVVFLNLWATWCGPCKAEMASIQELYNSVAKDSIEFVMISLDKDKFKDKVVRYKTDKNFTFPIYMPSGYLSAQLNVPSIPTTFIISKQGKIVLKEVGATNFNTKKFKNFLVDLAKK